MSFDFDVCIIGSGAGAGPAAMVLSEGGHSVVVLEKGPWLNESDFAKDEINSFRRDFFKPNLHAEPHVVETGNYSKGWISKPTPETDWNFWSGNMVGGASNLMSGFFLRLKPEDFKLLSTFGPITGANIADWPISYDDLEPFYDKVERLAGVSGKAVDHPFADRRSTPDFPFQPTLEHPIAKMVDKTCSSMGLHPFPLPRAILTEPLGERSACEYSGYCGGYGCTTKAKGSSRVAFLERSLKHDCTILPRCQVHRLISDNKGHAVAAEYSDINNKLHTIRAKVFIVACSAIETARLLLNSTGTKHPYGLANNNRQVGRNLIFSAIGGGYGDFPHAGMNKQMVDDLTSEIPFVNRALQDWYHYNDHSNKLQKGGTILVLPPLLNPIDAAMRLTFANNKRTWGWDLKRRIGDYFKHENHLMFELFADWLPTNDTHITLEPRITDQWGMPVSRVRVYSHHRNQQVTNFLAQRGAEIFKKMGAKNISYWAKGNPAAKLTGGTCRFGSDPQTSVLNAECRAHDVPNLFVSDGSFMPTGGSVPPTFTIYANSLRVAEHILGII